MESAMVISAALQEFYDANSHNQERLRDSIKTLVKLISNAHSKPDDKFRKIRFHNPKIQSAVVNPPGALDILALAGFSATAEDGWDKSTKKEDKFLSFDASQANLEIGTQIVHQLETRLAVLEFDLNKAAVESGNSTSTGSSKRKSTAATDVNTTSSSSTNTSNSSFTEEDRKRRQAQALASKKAAKAAKAEALRLFEEDKAAREEVEARRTRAKEAALKTGAGGFAPSSNIHIKRMEPNTTNTNAAVPAGDGTGTGARSEVLHPLEKLMLGGEPKPDTSDAGDAEMQEEEAKPAEAVVVDDEMQEEEDERKPAAVVDPMEFVENEKETNQQKEEEWKEYLKHIPRCGPAEGIRETSVFNTGSSITSSSSSSSPACLRKLLRELDGMKESLPCDANSSCCSIWVRFDEESPQYIRAIIAAALPGPTPYSGGLFCFDFFIPPDYPLVPPHCMLLTTGGGRVRFGPNLYANGKVCLSLLGTWPGPKWNAGVSNLSQVLLSIQGLILGAEHPYFLEPGHGGWEGNIKEGDFSSTGQTLGTGQVVTDDYAKLPIQAALYEDSLRNGTIRYAMLGMMQAVSASTTSPSTLTTAGIRYLKPFELPIQAHFYHNREAILKETSSWLRGGRSFAKAATTVGQLSHVPSAAMEQQQEKTLEQLRKLHPRLETALWRMTAPNLNPAAPALAAAADDESKNENLQEIAAMKPPPQHLNSAAPAIAASVDDKSKSENLQEIAAMKPPPQQALSEEKKDTPSSSFESIAAAKKKDPMEILRETLQEAADAGDYIRAGKLQADIQAINDLNDAMSLAASQNNFVRAGKLQEQLNARMAAIHDLANEEKKQSMRMRDLMMLGKKKSGISAGSSGASSSSPFDPDSMMGEEDHDDDDDMMDDEMPPAFAGMAGAMGQLPPNMFPPPAHKLHSMNPKHSWGGGYSLNSAGPTETLTTAGSGIRSGAACHLRIRLPGAAKVIAESFDSNDTLADVYRRIEPHVDPQTKGGSSSMPPNVAAVAQQKQVMTLHGPQMVAAPAFSQPMSLKGFTLLLAHPKREFSLEMHGMKSVEELGLVPNATVTVMFCTERGQVRRGELEDRLSQAQGDAMDVEGLGYEALSEFVERVGTSKPEWTEEDEQKLEQNSTLLSAAEYLAAVGDGNVSDNSQDRQCPICLGEFDTTDTSCSLRRLKTCPHVFHVACLSTWMQTKKCCPICKQPITPEL